MSNNNHIPFFSRFGMSLAEFSDKYDLGVLPAFLIFLVVVTLGMFLNFLAMRPVIGSGSAILISGLFESGIVAWKWTKNRKRNSDEQNELVDWATWISVFLAVIMLVINLFRTTIEHSLTVEPAAGVQVSGWQIAAFSTIGIAALVHIVFYLKFDGADKDKQYARKNKRTKRDIEQRRREAQDLVDNAEADLDVIEKITQDLESLRRKYIRLPHDKLEIILENARQALLVQYQASELVQEATAGLADMDGSGAIGDVPEEAPARLRVGAYDDEEDDLPGNDTQGRRPVPAAPRTKKPPQPVEEAHYYIYVSRVDLYGQSADAQRISPFYKVPAEQRETARYLLGQQNPADQEYRYPIGFYDSNFIERFYQERRESIPIAPLPFSLEGLRDRNGMPDSRARVLEVPPFGDNGKTPDPTLRRA